MKETNSVNVKYSYYCQVEIADIEKVSFEVEYYAHSETGSLIFSDPIDVSYVNSVELKNLFEFQIEQNGRIMPIDGS